jgi:hypothetical protein
MVVDMDDDRFRERVRAVLDDVAATFASRHEQWGEMWARPICETRDGHDERPEILGALVRMKLLRLREARTSEAQRDSVRDALAYLAFLAVVLDGEEPAQERAEPSGVVATCDACGGDVTGTPYQAGGRPVCAICWWRCNGGE